jgi:hypothetical protein
VFKDRTFLYGLGLGLILSVLLLQLTDMRTGAEEKLLRDDPNALPAEPAALTEDAVMKWAEENDFQLFPQSESLYTQEQLNTAVEEATEEAQRQITELQQEKHTRGFIIPSGATSTQVANLLKEMDLIQDAKVFEDTLDIRGLSTRIKPGYFEFEGSPTLDQIIEEIVNTAAE